MIGWLLVGLASAQTGPYLLDDPQYKTYVGAVDGLGYTSSGPIQQALPGMIAITDTTGVSIGQLLVMGLPPAQSETRVHWSQALADSNGGFKMKYTGASALTLPQQIDALEALDVIDLQGPYVGVSGTVTSLDPPTLADAGDPDLWYSHPALELSGFELWQKNVLVGYMLRERREEDVGEVFVVEHWLYKKGFTAVGTKDGTKKVELEVRTDGLVWGSIGGFLTARLAGITAYQVSDPEQFALISTL